MAQKLGAGGSCLHCLMVNPRLRLPFGWYQITLLGDGVTETHVYVSNIESLHERGTVRSRTRGLSTASLTSYQLYHDTF